MFLLSDLIFMFGSSGGLTAISGQNSAESERAEAEAWLGQASHFPGRETEVGSQNPLLSHPGSGPDHASPHCA